jgi:HEAT repeat protein
MRVDAARILGERRDLEALDVLVEMLHDRWHFHSITAAEALVLLGDVAAVPHLEGVYAECKAVCAGGHLHWDSNRLIGVLGALLQFRSAEDLQRLQREGSPVEQWGAARELDRRSAGPGAPAERPRE